MTFRHSKIRDFLPPLEAIRDPWIDTLLENPALIRRQMEEHGSPLNIHCLMPFARNYQEYASVFAAHQLRHLVLFARKANKSTAFVRAAASLGFGVDTASFRELQQCLQLGVEPEKLVFTAAIKDQRSLRLAIANGVLIILDNRDEWEQVRTIARDLGVKAQLGIRISGFEVDGEKLYSRFGFDIEEAYREITTMFAGEENRQLAEFRGLHFHLDGYSTRQRGIALHGAMDLAIQLKAKDLQTDFVDIGGGFLMNYLAEKSQFEQFEFELKSAVRGERPPLTFKNDGLGYEMVEGQLQGSLRVYPYFNQRPRAIFLEEVLGVSNEAGKTVSDRARSLDLEIRMEPGRSLLDQTGITVARVAHRKKDSRGDLLVGLEMNMTQMHSSSADFLLDPIVLHQHPEKKEGPVGAFFTGAYCLERDVLLKRKIHLEQVPAVGDLVVFLNTAGYMMHFFESEAHLFELAANLVFDPKSQRISPDETASFA